MKWFPHHLCQMDSDGGVSLRIAALLKMQTACYVETWSDKYNQDIYIK